MKQDCGVIMDLLPLYHDEVCSEKSRELVEEHLKECEACQKALEAIRKEVSAPNASMKDAGKAWRTLTRNLWIRRVTAVVLVVVLTVAAAAVGKEIYEWDQERTIWMGVDELEYGAYRLKDGRVYVEFIGREQRISVTESGPFELSEADGWIYGFRMGYNKAQMDSVTAYPERWEVISGDYEHVALGGASKDDITVICGTDDELPPATEEMEKRVAEWEAWCEENLNG